MDERQRTASGPIVDIGVERLSCLITLAAQKQHGYASTFFPIPYHITLRCQSEYVTAIPERNLPK